MFRFTIRDVLWLMVVVAVTVGWCVEHRSARRWQWAAEKLASHIKFTERADVKFTTKNVTINWPNNP